MVEVVTKKEMRDLREAKGVSQIKRQTLPKKKKSDREEMIDTLNKKRIDFKGNASNAELRKLVEESK